MTIDASIRVDFDSPISPTGVMKAAFSCGYSHIAYGSSAMLLPDDFEEGDWSPLLCDGQDQFLEKIGSIEQTGRSFGVQLTRENVGGNWHFMQSFKTILVSPNINTRFLGGSDVRLIDFNYYAHSIVGLLVRTSAFPARITLACST